MNELPTLIPQLVGATATIAAAGYALVRVLKHDAAWSGLFEAYRARAAELEGRVRDLEAELSIVKRELAECLEKR